MPPASTARPAPTALTGNEARKPGSSPFLG